MNFSDRNEYIEFRLQKAKESLKAAEILIENELWSSVINRLYYSCFYAVNALLVSNEIEAKTHSGLKNQFSLNFIKTGKIEKRFGELLSDLFDWRQQGDYGDIFEFEKEVVIGHIEPVRDFIIVVERIIAQQ
jgi:uncharacterized protein (UPF0332 family)